MIINNNKLNSNVDILMIDIQNHFLKYIYEDYLENINIMMEYINQVNNFLIKNKNNQLTIVVDQIDYNNNFQQETIETYIRDTENFYDINYASLEKQLNNLNIKELFLNNIPYPLINTIIENNIKFTLKTKEYGYIRTILDENLIETYQIINIINHIQKEYNIQNKYNLIQLLLSNDFRKNLLSIFQFFEINEDKFENYLIEILDENVINFDRNEILERYKHLNQEVCVIGGGKMECLLEEVVCLNTVFNHHNFYYINDLIYGEGDFDNVQKTLFKYKTLFSDKKKELIKNQLEFSINIHHQEKINFFDLKQNQSLSISNS